MKVYKEIKPICYEASVEARGILDWIEEHGLEDMFNSLCEECYPNGIEDCDFNDFLRYEDDFIKERLMANLPIYQRLMIEEEEKEEDE